MASIHGPQWFQELSADYLRWLARKGRRPNALKAYAAELRPLGRWLELEGVTDAHQLAGRQVERFQEWRARQVAPRTQHVSAAAVRGLLRWAGTQEPPLCPPPLWLRVLTPRTSYSLPKPIARADLEKLLAALSPRPSARDLVALRTRALFLVMLSSGARISETLSLDRDQLQDRQAAVIQKGGGEKLLIVSETAESAVTDYLAARRDSHQALFVIHNGAKATTRLGHQGVQWVWTQLCAELGIRRFTSHAVRHSSATELLRQGVDSLVIAKHLGHRGLQSIAGYAEVGLDARRNMLRVLDGRMAPTATSAPRLDECESIDFRGLSFRDFCELNGEDGPDKTWLPEDGIAWFEDKQFAGS